MSCPVALQELQKHEIMTFEFRQMVLEKMTGQVGTKVEPPWAVIGTKDGVVRDGELQDAVSCPLACPALPVAHPPLSRVCSC